MPGARGEESLETRRPWRHVLERHDERQVRAAGRHGVQDRVVRRVHEDLAVGGAVPDAGDVRHERHAPQAVGATEPEAMGDQRGAAVGRDHERGTERTRAAVRAHGLDAHDAAALDDDVGDPGRLPKVEGQRAHALDQERVQRLARDRHRVLAVGAVGPDRPIRAGDLRAVGRRDRHASERHGAVVHRLQHAQAVEHARRLRREVLAADLRPREACAIEQRHRKAVLREEDRRRSAGRPRAGDDHVRRGHV